MGPRGSGQLRVMWQKNISMMSACINCRTNSQVAIDWKRYDARATLFWVPNKKIN